MKIISLFATENPLVKAPQKFQPGTLPRDEDLHSTQYPHEWLFYVQLNWLLLRNLN